MMAEELGFSLGLKLLKGERTNQHRNRKTVQRSVVCPHRRRGLKLLLEGLGTQEEYPLWGKIFPKNLPSSCSQLTAGLNPRDLTKEEKKPQK